MKFNLNRRKSTYYPRYLFFPVLLTEIFESSRFRLHAIAELRYPMLTLMTMMAPSWSCLTLISRLLSLTLTSLQGFCLVCPVKSINGKPKQLRNQRVTCKPQFPQLYFNCISGNHRIVMARQSKMQTNQLIKPNFCNMQSAPF